MQGHQSFGPPKTKAGRRRVPIPGAIAEVLRDHIEKHGLVEDDLVFQSPEGCAVREDNFRQRIWLPAVRRAGLAPLRLHDLRHTAVSFWIAQGENAKKVAAMAGHKSVVVVFDRYGHLFPDDDGGIQVSLDAQFRDAKMRAQIASSDAIVLPLPA